MNGGGDSGIPNQAERAAGLLVIDDGYTLSGLIRPDRRPPVRVVYRPALPEAVYEYRMRSARAASGAERLEAVLWLLEAHLDSWDGIRRPVAGAASSPVPFKPGPAGTQSALRDPAVRKALGTEYLDEMVNLVTGYTPGEWEADRKNS